MSSLFRRVAVGACLLVSLPRASLAFTDIAAGLEAVEFSSVAWGDYDNDGDLDILLAGLSSSAPISRIYRNDSGSFTDIVAGLQGVWVSSVVWGDYDNDGDLDILLTGTDGSNTRVSRLYRNDAGVFTDIVAGLEGVADSSVAWGDYDNDGDLDILLTGADGSNTWVSRLYRNDAGLFTDIVTGLEGVRSSSVAWGDYDNDGDLDILLTGLSLNDVRTSRIYRNDSGSFTDIVAGLEGVWNSSVAWGDYDNDGDLDILLTGSDSSEAPISHIYRNDAGAFTNIVAGLERVRNPSAAWGDYDNDGDLDILLAGYSPSGRISRIYRNDSGLFTDIVAGLEGVRDPSVAWGDYDNDGDLDVLLTGRDASNTRVSRIYRNDATVANTAPTAPSGLSASVVAWVATFSWAASSDNETPSDGLSYNLRVGTTPGGDEISAAATDGSGYRRIPALGSAQQNLSWSIDVSALSGATLYWSVQAVDTGFVGSSFELGESLFVEPFTDVVAGLEGVYSSSVAWGDYDHDGDLDILLTGENQSDTPISSIYRNHAGVFTNVGAGLEGVRDSSVAWGDYDNDGDLDILLTGERGPGELHQPTSHIYRNEAGMFNEVETGIENVYSSSVAWGDYDNDGDLDILLTGGNALNVRISRIYRNDAGAFTDIDAGLVGVASSSAVWGDHDNDGDLDILLTGSPGQGPRISRIYRNDAGVFTDIVAGLEGVYLSTAVWGDYDNDGDLDILLTGSNASNAPVTRIYRNDAAIANTAPTAPSGLSASVSAGVATLRWEAASDNETPAEGLSYNLLVGTSPGTGDLFSGMSDYPRGYRLIPSTGNASHNLSWSLDLSGLGLASFYWSVQAVDTAFAGSVFTRALHTVGIDDTSPVPDPRLPTRYALHENIPNPFNPSTEISFDLPEPVQLSLKIYSVSGRLIKTLIGNKSYQAGRHAVIWAGRDDAGLPVASGVYFYRLETENRRVMKRMTLLK